MSQEMKCLGGGSLVPHKGTCVNYPNYVSHASAAAEMLLKLLWVYIADSSELLSWAPMCTSERLADLMPFVFLIPPLNPTPSLFSQVHCRRERILPMGIVISTPPSIRT